MRHLFFLFLFCSLLAPLELMASTENCFVTAHWRVYIINDIPDNNIVTLVKSGDDDLGNHTIPFLGNYTWDFCQRFDYHTQYFAYFWWGPKFQTFTVFGKGVIREYCPLKHWSAEECFWLVKDDGFYVSKTNELYSSPKWKKVYSWQDSIKAS